MSTGVLIAIIVVAVIIVAVLAFVLPKARARARQRAEQRELEKRREQAVSEHREQAGERTQPAAVAERRARMPADAAERERAEARLHEERASLHDQGLADDDLVRTERSEDR